MVIGNHQKIGVAFLRRVLEGVRRGGAAVLRPIGVEAAALVPGVVVRIARPVRDAGVGVQVAEEDLQLALVDRHGLDRHGDFRLVARLGIGGGDDGGSGFQTVDGGGLRIGLIGLHHGDVRLAGRPGDAGKVRLVQIRLQLGHEAAQLVDGLRGGGEGDLSGVFRLFPVSQGLCLLVAQGAPINPHVVEGEVVGAHMPVVAAANQEGQAAVRRGALFVGGDGGGFQQFAVFVQFDAAVLIHRVDDMRPFTGVHGGLVGFGVGAGAVAQGHVHVVEARIHRSRRRRSSPPYPGPGSWRPAGRIRR